MSALSRSVAAGRNPVSGDFLGDFSVVDSDPFEEWRNVLQEQLHIQMLDALTVLANAAEVSGDEEQALQDAQRQLALEPWLEAAHRRIMRILAQRGQRNGALAQYNRCRQVLANELGVEPDGETMALYEQIQRGEFDKEARRQGDRVGLRQAQPTVTELVEVTGHPLILSPCHPLP
ncbi:MAG: bacterial transcriptional activator domain-containing protein [Caldilineaceae bacterium]